MSLKNRLDRIETALDLQQGSAPTCIEDYLAKPFAALVAAPYLAARASDDLLPVLLALPAQTARNVITLLQAIDAGALTASAAPAELNTLAAAIVADDLAVWEARQADHALPAWAADRLTAGDIQQLLSTATGAAFGTLESTRAALARLDREAQA